MDPRVVRNCSNAVGGCFGIFARQFFAVYDSRVLLSFMRAATPSTMVVICWTQLEPTRALFETSKVLPAVLVASPRVPRMSIIIPFFLTYAFTSSLSLKPLRSTWTLARMPVPMLVGHDER